jgi:hypothetical protein
MASEPKNKKPDSKKESAPPPSKADQKTSETVHLSSEELRKISGGATSQGGGPNPH